MKHKYETNLIKNKDDDSRWEANCKWILTKLPRCSKVTAYQLKDKSDEDRFDNQSCWLDIYYYEKDPENFRTRQSHKNNQYIRIEIEIAQ